MFLRLKLGHIKHVIKETMSFAFSKNILVFGSPFNSNAGDFAQSYCIQLWARKNYPNHKIKWYDGASMAYSQYESLTYLKRVVKKHDIIFLHSGYHTTDLYMWEEELQRQVIKAFPKHRIIALPQTINYTTEKEKNKSIQIYNQHKDLFFFCRDSVSYKEAKHLFYNSRLYLFPDIVTSMIGQRNYNHIRKGILLCLRNDKEAVLKADEREKLKLDLGKIDKVTETDTTLKIEPNEFKKNREKILEDLWSEYAKYKVVITDRYHGTIFSLIAATPVLVIPSSDHKLSSGVDWFPESYKEYVKYLSDISSIPDEVARIYQTDYQYRLPSYFKENYYDKLKSIIESD